MRVLIVDDDFCAAELTADCLRIDPSIQVQIAGDGATALQVVAEFQPDAVLLDVHLPDASGLDLAPKLKTACLERPARIVIFSGSVLECASNCLPAGVDSWLTKPAHLDTLLDCIFPPEGTRKL